MQVFDLFNTDYERRLTEGAVDKLEQRRIDDLNMKMDELAHRVKSTSDPAHKKSLLKAFLDCKEERDGYYKVKTDEGSMKHMMHKDAERMSREAFCEKYGDEHGEFWDNIMGELDEGKWNYPDYMTQKANQDDEAELGISGRNKDRRKEWRKKQKAQAHKELMTGKKKEQSVDEAGIGQDIADKAEKIARATPQSKAGAVASTVKNAAKWLAGKGGPGREGPTYEGAEDIEDRGEYDREGDMAKDNIHTIVRNARELEAILGDNDNLPEWVQDKLANIKGMMTAVSEYMQTQHERDHEEVVAMPEGTETQWKKESDWKAIPKAKSGKPADPRGEVTHLSDVARREAEHKADQKKNSEEVEEGWQDFNKVEPYAVCLAGKPVKKFDYYEEARRFHDNWKQKLYREGDKAKADKITLMPLGLDEDDPMGGATVAIGQMAGADADTNPGNLDEDTGSWIVYDPETKQIKKRFKTHTAGKSYAKTHGLGFASSEYYFDNVKPTVAEMDKSQKSYNRHGDYSPGDKGTIVKPVTAKKVVKDLSKELDAAFNTPELLKKDADYRAYRKGVRQSRKEQPKTLPPVDEEKTRLDPKCWKGKKIGNPKTKMKGGVRVNNCVPAEESYTGVMESQGVTDTKLLDVARRIDAFAKTIK